MKTCLVLLLALLGAFAPSPVRAADDLHVIYEEGRAAFNAGAFELAREKLNQVAAKNPNHGPTQAMLATINQKLGADNSQLRKAYGSVVLDKIDFADVSLEEAVEALRILSRKASGDKVSPNIIIKNPEIGKKTVTINLSKVPLTEVLNYLAELTGARITYDKNAVMFTSKAG